MLLFLQCHIARAGDEGAEVGVRQDDVCGSALCSTACVGSLARQPLNAAFLECLGGGELISF